jgi:hypothetical protein
LARLRFCKSSQRFARNKASPFACPCRTCAGSSGTSRRNPVDPPSAQCIVFLASGALPDIQQLG